MKSLGNTKLYRTLKKKITSISNKELLKQLNIAYSGYKGEKSYFSPKTTYLSGAFVFHQTPQGEAYWWGLNNESEGIQ